MPTRVQPEGGFKNRNLIPDLTKHNSRSFYRNRNINFPFPVLVNPEPEFEFLVLVPAKPEPEIEFYRISGRNLPELNFSSIDFILKMFIKVRYAF